MRYFISFLYGLAWTVTLHAQPIVLDTTVDVCQRLATSGHSLIQGSQWKAANDTLRTYIEHCANQSGSFHQFSALDGAVQFMSNDNNRWLDYRAWLKKVLYLSMDSFYYCADANSILTTLQYVMPNKGVDFNGEVAVIDFLLQNHNCPDDSSFLVKFRKNIRDKQIGDWRDTVKDSTKSKPDTAEVTLESLDLQILRGIQFAVQPTTPHGSNRIAAFIASTNPFNAETTLRYDLNEATLVKVEIYDALGNIIYTNGEGLQEQGDHTIRIDGKSFPTGSYFARLSTYSGEVKTIKLIHLR